LGFESMTAGSGSSMSARPTISFTVRKPISAEQNGSTVQYRSNGEAVHEECAATTAAVQPWHGKSIIELKHLRTSMTVC
jgi:hypothetical protein